MSTSGVGEFRDSLMITSMVARSHPKLGEWVHNGSLVKVEYARHDHTDTTSLHFEFSNGQRLAIDLRAQPRAGSLIRRDITLMDSIQEALTEENIARMALLRVAQGDYNGR